MKLIKPCEKYYDSYIKAFKEYEENNISSYSFLNKPLDELLTFVSDRENGINLPKGIVPSVYVWLVNEDEFLGEANIRLELTEPLLKFGGNIGYGVAYSYWNKGVGTQLLSKTLEYIKNNFSLNKVLITCNDNNIGSIRVIEKNGGVLQDKVTNVVDGIERLSRRYWVDIIRS